MDDDVHLQKSATDSNMREPMMKTRSSATQELTGNLVEVPSGPYTDDADLFADAEWYGLSLAEAGVEQFVGYEPSSLFQQGWKTFS